MPGLNVVNNGGADKRAKFLAAVVKDLKAAGPSARGRRSPPACQRSRARALINEKLGSAERHLHQASRSMNPLRYRCSEDSRGRNVRGQVSTLVILGGNPVYSAPADLHFAVAFSKVANSIHLGLEEDETAAAANWHMPEAHFLETGATKPARRSRHDPAADDRTAVRRQDAAEVVALGRLQVSSPSPTTSSRITG